MSAVIEISAGRCSLEERKARVQEMKEMREKRRVVLDKPMNPLSDISSVVKRRTVSIAVPTAPATVSVQVQANSSRQQNLERVRARCAALREENQVREEAEKKKRDEEEVRAAFKKLAEEKMKVVTPDEIRITSISRQRDVKPVKGCLKQVKANPYGTIDNGSPYVDMDDDEITEWEEYTKELNENLVTLDSLNEERQNLGLPIIRAMGDRLNWRVRTYSKLRVDEKLNSTQEMPFFFDQVIYGEEDEEELDSLLDGFTPEDKRYNWAILELKRVRAYHAGKIDEFEEDIIEMKQEVLKENRSYQGKNAVEEEEKRLLVVKAARARVQAGVEADQEARRERICPAAPRKLVRVLSGDVREWAEAEESVTDEGEEEEEYSLDARVGLLAYVALE